MTRQEIPPWVILEAEKKPRRKPGPKPKQPKTKLQVTVNVSGSVSFELEGKDADELKSLLTTFQLDEVIEFVDPWASGAELRYDVEVTDETGIAEWEANETTGTIELREWRFR